jgi:hypothetical protein
MWVINFLCTVSDVMRQTLSSYKEIVRWSPIGCYYSDRKHPFVGRRYLCTLKLQRACELRLKISDAL